MHRSSLALGNLRAFAILSVLAFHSFIAYMAQPDPQLPFDSPPFDWTGRPIVDADRWLGFDLFCAFQYLYLMHLMFFLSGLFVWQSLHRKGGRAFLYDRFVRLGVPFVVGTYLLMPVAYYPAYRAIAADPSWSAYWAQWKALPLWPTGPMWFLSSLLALNIIVTGIHWIAPRAGDHMARLSVRACAKPCLAFLVLLGVSALTYVPLSLVYNPWDWLYFGPFALQASFGPQYVLFFALGLALGAQGLEHGPLAPDGVLARHWRVLIAGGLTGFVIWIVPTALIVEGNKTAGLSTVADIGFVLTSAAACLGLTGVFLRFAGRYSPALNSLSENAYGIYFVHYPFVIWLQYALLGVALFAVVKAAIVFTVSLALSWAASAALGRIPFGARLMRARGRAAPTSS
jgi:hypothetical protein